LAGDAQTQVVDVRRDLLEQLANVAVVKGVTDLAAVALTHDEPDVAATLATFEARGVQFHAHRTRPSRPKTRARLRTRRWIGETPTYVAAIAAQIGASRTGPHAGPTVTCPMCARHEIHLSVVSPEPLATAKQLLESF
jgi:hypothetical protein